MSAPCEGDSYSMGLSQIPNQLDEPHCVLRTVLLAIYFLGRRGTLLIAQHVALRYGVTCGLSWIWVVSFLFDHIFFLAMCVCVCCSVLFNSVQRGTRHMLPLFQQRGAARRGGNLGSLSIPSQFFYVVLFTREVWGHPGLTIFMDLWPEVLPRPFLV